MFWRFGFTTSAIDTHLDREDIKLCEILEEEDFLQEVKSHNQKLIVYLCQSEILAELLGAITATDLDESRSAKYPILACEVVACEIPQIMDTMAEDKAFLQTFWSFLDRPATPPDQQQQHLDSIQVQCFCKVIDVLLAHKTTEMTDFIRADSKNLSKILAHVQNPAVMELLLSLVRLEELPHGRGMVKWLSDEGLLNNLVARLDPNLDTEEHSIAQQCICEVIRVSQTNSIELPSIGINDLIIGLKSNEVMTRIVNYMLDPEAPNSTSSLINGVAIIIDLIRHNNSDMEGDPMDPTNESTQHSSVSLADMLKVLVDHVHDFKNLLTHPKSVRESVSTTLGKQMALGYERLKICELFAELLHCSNMSNLNTKVDSSTTQPDHGPSNEIKEDKNAEEANETKESKKAKETAGIEPQNGTTESLGTNKPVSDKSKNIETSFDTEPVGDQLKIKFIEHKVLPTCIELFFDFPWNNLLHYVTFDMLRQVFNGPMSPGYNRELAIAIFRDGRLTDRIIQAQKENDEICGRPKGMRLGYMGHLTFIADEIVKLFEGYHDVIVEAIQDVVNFESWDSYCDNELKATKERDQLPLGGTQPPEDLDHEIRSDGDLENLEDATARSQYTHYLAQRGGMEADDDEDEEQDGWISGRDINGYGPRFGMMHDGEDELEEDEYASDDEENSPNPFTENETAKPTPEDREDVYNEADGAEDDDDDDDDDEDDPFGDFESGDMIEEDEGVGKAFESLRIHDTNKATGEDEPQNSPTVEELRSQ